MGTVGTPGHHAIFPIGNLIHPASYSSLFSIVFVKFCKKKSPEKPTRNSCLSKKDDCEAPEPPTGGTSRDFSFDVEFDLLFVFFELLHIQVSSLYLPSLMGLDGQCANQPQTAGFIGKGSDDMGTPFDLLIHSLEHVG